VYNIIEQRIMWEVIRALWWSLWHFAMYFGYL